MSPATRTLSSLSYDFISTNYLNTTYYNRAKINFGDKEESVLVAGDILTFKVQVGGNFVFDLGIYVSLL